MTITISLPPEIEEKLQQRAAERGQSIDGYVRQLIERDVRREDGDPSSLPAGTTDEALAPVREEFERSGLTDEELAALVEDVRTKIWQEKQSRKGS